jgi:glutamate N-acetyltransferase/amino-acid N-acetyltransferase
MSEEELAKKVAVPEVFIHLDLGAGQGSFTEWTCDFTYDYVKINADYHT